MKKLNFNKTILPDRKPERGIKMMSLMAMFVFASFWGMGQTVLINPATNGGFESGTTFAANGWTVINAGSGNLWQVGTATKSAGTRSAYISNDGGTTNNYTNFAIGNASRVVHFYRDVTFPAGETQITLTFKWRCNGQNNNDDIKVFLGPTSAVPVSGTEYASGTLLGGGYYGQSSTYQTVSITIPAANAGTTKRLIFSWRNNNDFSGSNPGGSFDEISLTTCAPPAITASSNTPACTGSSLNLTASGTGTYSWDGPNGFTSTSQNPSISNLSALAAGTYSVTVTSASGCSNTTTTTVAVNPVATGVAPTASVASVCSGTNFNLSANTGVAASLSNTTDFAIPDNNATGISSPITVANGFLASQVVSVTLNITHSYDADLDIYLKAPNGSLIELSTDNGGSGNNYTNTVFVTGASSITTGAAPFTGNFAPEQAFSTLTGSANGTWNLVVKDDAANDLGTLLDWTISVISSTGVTYTWSSTPSGFTSSSPRPTASLSANTTYSVTANLAGCSSSTGSVAVAVLAAPTAVASSNTPVCKDADINLIGSGGVSYSWSGPNGFTSVSQNPVISAAQLNAAGTYTMTVTNAFGCTASTTHAVVVNSRPTLSIGSQTNVSCNGGSNGQFQMNVAGGTSPYIYTDGSNYNGNGAFSGYTAGTVTVTVTDNVGCEDSKNVNITEPGPVTVANAGADKALCNATTTNLSGNIAVVGIGTWTLISGTATITNPLSPTTSVTGLGFGQIVLRWTINQVGCSSNFDDMIIQNTPLATVANAGSDQTLCNVTSANVIGNTPVYGNPSWSLISGTATIDHPSSVSTSLSGLGTGTIVLRYTITQPGCSQFNDDVVIENKPVESAAVAGSDQTFCNVGTSSVSAVTPVIGQGLWTVVSGTANISNPTFATTGLTGLGTGNIVLRWTVSQPGCSSNSDDVVITNTASAPAQPVAITGATVACPPVYGSTFSIAPVADATSYLWYLGPGTNGVTFTTPVDGTSITADFGTTTNSGYTIRVQAMNACGAGTYQSTFLRRTISTPQLSGSSQACPNDVKSFSIPTPVVGAVSYTWTGPAGTTFNGNAGPFTTTSLNVNAQFANTFVSGNVCVIATGPCGIPTPSRCMAVSSIPARPNNINGLTKACPGSTLTYSCTVVDGATSYNWGLPSGATITNGAGTSDVTISFSNSFNGGNICVTAVNPCTTSVSRCINVQKATPAMPGNVTGPVSGLCGGTHTFSVPNEAGILSYNWSVPSGAVIVSGAGTNTVDVDFTGVTFPTAANQYLQMAVAKTNTCSTGPARIVSVKGVPANAVSISGPSAVCSEESGLLFTVPSVFGAGVYNWTVPAGVNIISGQGTNSIYVDWGLFSGVVGVTASNACGNGGTKTMLVTVGNCRMASSASSAASNVNVYPNPASSSTNVTFNSKAGNDFKVKLIDLSGREILSQKGIAVEGLNELNLDLSKIAKGAYMVNLINGNETSQIRLIVE